MEVKHAAFSYSLFVIAPCAVRQLFQVHGCAVSCMGKIGMTHLPQFPILTSLTALLTPHTTLGAAIDSLRRCSCTDLGTSLALTGCAEVTERRRGTSGK